MSKQVLWPALLLLVVLTGCSSLPRDDGREQVITWVNERLPATVAAGATLPATSAPLTLNAALTIALNRNPRLRGDYARLQVGAAEWRDAARWPNPVLSVTMLTAGGPSKLDAGFALGMAELLLRGSRLRLAQAEYRSLQQSIAADVLSLAFEVQHAWIEAVAANQRLAVRREIAAAATVNGELAQRYFAAGNLDALNLQLQLAGASEAQLAVQRAAADLLRSRLQLQQLLGLAATENDWQLPESLPMPVRAEPALDELQRLGTQRLDLLAARTRVTSLQQSLPLSRRQRLLSDAEVGIAGEREAGQWRTGPSARFTLPLFNQGRNAAERSLARLEQAQSEQQQLELAIGNQLRSSDEQLRLARMRYQQYREQLVPQREAVVAELQRRVDFMLAGGFELLLARQQELQAYEGAVDALRDYWYTRAELMQASGTLWQETQS